jgi:two-component system sensor histidine kinase/response regulator
MLLNLINDLLDLAKMENSSFNLNASYFNLLEDVISKSVTTLNHMIKQKNLNVIIENTKGPGLPDGCEHYLRSIHGDKSRFLQILLNFLSNALKFTPEGGTVKIMSIVKET